jgi:alkaline phosphatase D
MFRWWLFPTLLLFIFEGCHDQALRSNSPTTLLSVFPTVASVGSLPSETPFPYGVASGDPLSNAVIIWTMLDRSAAQVDSSVTWELSKTPTFEVILQTDTVTATAAHHFRIKEDIRGLEPGTTYFFRFAHQGNWSRIGRTKTAPASNYRGEVRLGVVSCNALEWGYFNAFEVMALESFDVIIHLGDYIYEYASGVYGDTTIGRMHQPKHEILTEKDYHQRYAQYRSDPQLQLAHANHPFICVWDDHEVANNSHTQGAENHNPQTEGDYLTRMTAAKAIYYDWMPVREQASGELYRSFQFGQTADLHMLDERLAARTAPAKDFSLQALTDTTKHILGEDQLEWLAGQLASSTGNWQLIGNQVLFAKLDLANILPQYAVNLDAWDGFRHEKYQLVDSLRKQGNPNTVFLTGDTHCSWYFEVKPSPQDELPLAHEFGTPSVSSANYDEFIQGWDTLSVAKYRLYRDNPNLEYTNLSDHGFLQLDITPDDLTATFRFLKDIRRPDLREKSSKSFRLEYVHTSAR